MRWKSNDKRRLYCYVISDYNIHAWVCCKVYKEKQMTLLIIWTLSFAQPEYIFVMQDEDTCHELGMEFMRDSIHNAIPFEYHCMKKD